MRTIKGEEVMLHDDVDFHAAYQGIDWFLDHVYQHRRMHSALGYLPPAEFETQWRQQTTAASAPLEKP